MLRLAENVYYDSGSELEWRQLNETTFLERVLRELRQLMGDRFARYEVFVFSAPRGSTRPVSADGRPNSKVLIYLSDESGAVPTELDDSYLVIFKSYLARDVPGRPIFPFPVGYVRDVGYQEPIPVDLRPISVFFSGNLNFNRLEFYRALHPVYRRTPALVYRIAQTLAARGFGERVMPRDLSRTLPDAEVIFNDGFRRGLPPHVYGQKLGNSRVALCPRGWQSAETFRHFEAARAGAIVVSEPLPDTHFYRGAPMITVADWMDGIRRVEQLIGDTATLQERQKATMQWWETVWSERAVARYLRDRIEEVAIC